MPLSKTYYARGNFPLPNVSSTTNTMKSFLHGLYVLLRGLDDATSGTAGAPPVGSDWTLEGSSDSAAATMDTTERLITLPNIFLASAWVRATAGNPHTWFVLGKAGIGHICIDWCGSADGEFDIIFSRNAFTGGSTTARPTAVNETKLTSAVVADITAAAHCLTQVVDANGYFGFLMVRTGTGKFQTIFGLPEILQVKSGDTWPFFPYFESVTSGRGPGQYNGSMPICSGAAGFCGRSPNGSANYDSGSATGVAPAGAGAAYHAGLLPNQGTGEADFWPCIFWFRGGSNTVQAIRGVVADWDWCNEWKNVGETTPDPTPTRVVVGHLVMPHGGVALTM